MVNANNSYAAKQDIAKINQGMSEMLEVMKDGFAQMGEFANRTEARFDSIDNRFNRVENGMSKLDQRLLALESAFETFKNEQLAMSADIKDILNTPR